jgi:hypothetical protein
MSPAFADETTITINQETPYVDIPIEAVEPTTITIQTISGTPQNNPNFVDTWIELWQGLNRIAADDDSNYSPTNILASIITRPIDAGLYFIRATSFAGAVTNYSQRPNGTYLLTWNGVLTVPSPTPTPTETITPSPEPTPTVEPSPTPEVTPEPTQIPTEDNSNSEPILPVVLPSLEPIPMPTEIVIPEPEIVEQIVVPETIETPVVEPELSVEEIQQQIQEQVDQEYIAENTIELQLPTALADIPGVAEIFAATEAILNVGSDMTETQREESQSVVVGAIVVTQIASMASAASVQASSKRNETKRIRRK